MNDNRRAKIMLLAFVGVLALVFVGYKFFYQPYQAALGEKDSASDQLDQIANQTKLHEIDKQLLVSKWNQLSLPSNQGRAATEYGAMLKPLLGARMKIESFVGPPPTETRVVQGQKKAQHQILAFNVRAKGTLEDLVDCMEQLRRIPVAHRIKSLVVDRLDAKDTEGRLGIQMVIETLIVAGAKNEPSLKPISPTAIEDGSVMKWIPSSTRDFNTVALRNPFVGQAARVVEDVGDKEAVVSQGIDMRQYVHLDMIQPGKEAFLRNRLAPSPIRLRLTPGFNTFQIKSDESTYIWVKAKVLRIDARDIYFQAGDKLYGFHFGQTLSEAMKAPLRESEADRLEMTDLIDPEFADQDLGAKKTPQKGGATKGKTKTKTVN